MNPDDVTLLDETLRDIKTELREVRRAVVGAPLEGNPGLVQRMEKQEKRTAVLLWLSPIWIVGGTSIGTLLTGWWGIS